jgi:hypothetical protein
VSYAEQHRQWLLDNAINPDSINPFSGKSYRSMIFEWNLTHPENKIEIKEVTHD